MPRGCKIHDRIHAINYLEIATNKFSTYCEPDSFQKSLAYSILTKDIAISTLVRNIKVRRAEFEQCTHILQGAHDEPSIQS